MAEENPGMRLFVDCEFNGFGGELISMALVSERGHEWYEVLPLPSGIDPWVAENVVPILGKAPISPEDFRRSLHSFLKQYARPTIVADWYADLVHFFACLAGREHSESLHFPCTAELLEDVPNFAPEIPHNALSDARAIMNAIVFRFGCKPN